MNFDIEQEGIRNGSEIGCIKGEIGAAPSEHLCQSVARRMKRGVVCWSYGDIDGERGGNVGIWFGCSDGKFTAVADGSTFVQSDDDRCILGPCRKDIADFGVGGNNLPVHGQAAIVNGDVV